MFWGFGLLVFGCLVFGLRKSGFQVAGVLGVFRVHGLIWGSDGFGVSDFEFLDCGFCILAFGF